MRQQFPGYFLHHIRFDLMENKRRIMSSSSKCMEKMTLPYLICFFLSVCAFNILPSVAQGDKGKIRACYFMHKNVQNFSGDAIDPLLCSHIILAGGVITPDGVNVSSPVDWKQYRAVVGLKSKSPHLKVMISLQHGFPSVVDSSDTGKIERFCYAAMTFLKKLNMDGIDLDWEFPQVHEKNSYARFIKILSKFLHTSNMLLSMALPPTPFWIDNGFDIPTINRSVDFATIMSYDYHSFNAASDNVTGYNSPLYTPKGENIYLSTAASLTFFLYKGLSKDKILMGIPLYGRSWTLANPDVHGLHSPATDVGPPAPYTHGRGMYAYPDVCTALHKGATTVKDEENVGQYLYSGSTWVAFDGEFSIQKKMEWLKRRDLAGFGVWAYQLDDLYNVCGHGQMPLLRALNKYYLREDTNTLYFHSEH